MNLRYSSICKTLLILSLAWSQLSSAQLFTAKSHPVGSSYKTGRSTSASKWVKSLPVETLKLGEKLEFLVGISDHSKLLYSEDKKIYRLLDIKTGKKAVAFTQTEGASWVGARGNTIITRVGFGEQYIFRNFPDFKSSALWSPPNGAKANGFALGSRSRDFLCFTTDKNVHQFSLTTLKPSSKLFFLDSGENANGYPPSTWSIKKTLHLKESSSDLKVVIVGRFLYRKDETGAERMTQFLDLPDHDRLSFLSGSGDLLNRLFELRRPIDSPPSSNLVVGRVYSGSKEMLFTFADTSRSLRLFSISTNLAENHQNPPEIHEITYCQPLNKLIFTDAKKGVIHLVDVDVESLKKVYPSQLSKQHLEVTSLKGFSYQPSFSRSEFIESYGLVHGDHNWEIDPKSGRLTPKEHHLKSAQNFSHASFFAKLKGGDTVGGFVSIKIKK